jgi:hypothetical protein
MSPAPSRPRRAALPLRALPLLVLLAVLAPRAGLAALPASGWRDVPYEDVAKMPLALGRLDPERIFRYSYSVKPAKGHAVVPAGLRLQVRAAGQIVPVPVGADGRVEFPIRQDWSDGGAVVQINQPKGIVNLSLNFEPRTPPGTRMSYARLAESAPVMERGIREMAGMMRFLAPKVRALALRFAEAGPQSLTLLHPGGKRQVFRTDAKGVLQVPWNPGWSAATVELSAPLKQVGPVMK